VHSSSISTSKPSSLCFNGHFPGEPGLAGFIEDKDDGGGGDSWSYKSCKAPVKSSPTTNQRYLFLTVGDAMYGSQYDNSKRCRWIFKFLDEIFSFNTVWDKTGRK